MVLHHIKDLDFTFREIKRILKKGGYFLIKEHNAISKADCMLYDIEHAVYEIVDKKVPNYDFRKEEYSHYRSWVEWNIILKRYGFVEVKRGVISYSIFSQTIAGGYFFALYKKL